MGVVCVTEATQDMTSRPGGGGPAGESLVGALAGSAPPLGSVPGSSGAGRVPLGGGPCWRGRAGWRSTRLLLRCTVMFWPQGQRLWLMKLKPPRRALQFPQCSFPTVHWAFRQRERLNNNNSLTIDELENEPLVNITTRIKNECNALMFLLCTVCIINIHKYLAC